MNFFDRRRVLKSTSFTDLTPIACMENEISETGKVTVLVPKFKNKILTNIFIPSRKSDHFSIKLDEVGSEVWKLIDNKRSAGEICDLLKKSTTIDVTPLDEIETRVSKFIAMLYEQRYITFKELQNK